MTPEDPQHLSNAAVRLIQGGRQEYIDASCLEEKKQKLLRARSALFLCDERFGHAFQEWLSGETITGWIARCDWKEYGRLWFLDAVVPASQVVRDLIPDFPELAADDFTAPWRGSREPDRHTIYIAEVFRSLTRTDRSRKDLEVQADEVGVVLASDHGNYWRRYHAHFVVLAGRIDDILNSKPDRRPKAGLVYHEMTWQQRAILLLSEGNTVTQVAEAVGKSRSALYRDSTTKTAVSNLRSLQQPGSIRGGQKHEGRIEAFDDAE